MGSFYTNYTLKGPSQEDVVKAMAGRSAFVTPAENGCVVVFDQQSDDHNPPVLEELASRLSTELRCIVLVVLNHDDDILLYQLYENGELTDEYNSAPDYFEDSDSEELADPAGGNAEVLCRAFGSGAVAEVEQILRKSGWRDEGYEVELERHEDLVRALGIPSFTVGANYESISSGELPEGLDKDDLMEV